ncbi:MAG: GntR family transcriptional regulator [Albidovulum sp.]|nr:GntR family transcriptional regulator [Albidovulum sp.]
MITLKPLNLHSTLKDQIYGVLREAILEADVYDESASLKMDERHMAAQLGISRTPLREALTRLENEGLVEIQARKGVYVKRLSLKEIVEMITVWAALESMAARLACEKASDDEIEALRMIGARYTMDSAAARLNEYSESNIEFHRTIIHLSKCTRLQEISEDLFSQLRPVRRRALRDTKRAHTSVGEHAKIVEAIAARDAVLAADLVRDHTIRLGDYIRNTWIALDGNGKGQDF